ncbi:MAG: transporter substrate-binding domain-containing protein [Deltaproteobacteria bacterium]|nr:transporter substrate-binding domain-containing protein [Deltaproteobacteria bacterium]
MFIKTWLRLILTIILIVYGATLAHALDMEKVYKFGLDIDYPPFSFMDEKTGMMAGFDADIANAVCKTIGIKCEVLGINFDEIIPMIQRGDLDVGTAGFGFTEERASVVLFTDKYYRSNSIFVQNDLGILEITPESIKGKTVAVQRGTIQEAYLRTKYRDTIDILLCNTLVDTMEAVRTKKTDLALADGIATYTYLRTPAGKDLDIAGDPIPIQDDDALMAVNKDNTELCDSINWAIKQLRATGEYDLINLKYFNYNIY